MVGKTTQQIVMTVFYQQKHWFISDCQWINTELYIECIHNGNGKHDDLYFILLECIKQFKSKVFHSNNIQFIAEFMQIYFELHSYFGGILHYINSIKHIINLLKSCHIPKIALCMNLFITALTNSLSSTDTKHIDPSTQILSFNTNDIVSILKM